VSDLLSIGASGIRAYSAALSAVGNNVSNATTAGYTRRTVTLSESTTIRSADIYSDASPTFGGVRSTGVTRAWDDYQALAVRNANSDAGATGMRATWYAATENALNDTATGVGQSATAFFNAGDALSADVNSSANQQAFLSSLSQTASAFNTTASSLAQVSSSIAQQMQTSVQTLNSKLDTLDKVNTALNSSVPGSSGAADLMDQRDQLLDDISSQVGISVKLDEKGVATVSLANSGVQLSNGVNNSGHGARLTFSQGANGVLAVKAASTSSSASGQDVGDVGGAIGGLVDSAQQVAGRRNQLDQMAADFIGSVNSWQASGKVSAGGTPPDLLTGADAASISLAANLKGSDIAVAAKDGSSTNGNILALSGLRTSAGVEQNWSAMVTDQGQKVSAAKTADTAATSTQDAAKQARDSTSGVDLDTEAAQLLRYQQAYSGAAKVIQVAKDTMDSILNLF
jgi:flagellar hook-associated protein 1